MHRCIPEQATFSSRLVPTYAHAQPKSLENDASQTIHRPQQAPNLTGHRHPEFWCSFARGKTRVTIRLGRIMEVLTYQLALGRGSSQLCRLGFSPLVLNSVFQCRILLRGHYGAGRTIHLTRGPVLLSLSLSFETNTTCNLAAPPELLSNTCLTKIDQNLLRHLTNLVPEVCPTIPTIFPQPFQRVCFLLPFTDVNRPVNLPLKN